MEIGELVAGEMVTGELVTGAAVTGDDVGEHCPQVLGQNIVLTSTSRQALPNLTCCTKVLLLPVIQAQSRCVRPTINRAAASSAQTKVGARVTGAEVGAAVAGEEEAGDAVVGAAVAGEDDAGDAVVGARDVETGASVEMGDAAEGESTGAKGSVAVGASVGKIYRGAAAVVVGVTVIGEDVGALVLGLMVGKL